MSYVLDTSEKGELTARVTENRMQSLCLCRNPLYTITCTYVHTIATSTTVLSQVELQRRPLPPAQDRAVE